MICEYCEKDHNGSFGSGRFCSSHCARSYSSNIKRKETNIKVSKIMKGKIYGKRSIKKSVIITTICSDCNITFSYILYPKTKIRNRCGKCSKIYGASIGGKKSAQCRNLRSKNEIKFANLCENEYKDILCNKPIFNGWDADIIIPHFKVAVLWNGIWHRQKVMKQHSLLQVQNRDRIKIKEIKKCGYYPYVINDTEEKEIVQKEFEKFKQFISNL
jgi:hypothetical protein